ncbi:MAG TPA: hypothetical protein VH275_08215 [Solirubrobacterales bacterium]|nr:hypothetical protein [Solirubrobacterales bacterium]
MPRGDAMDGVGIVRYSDAVPGQLVTESYRSRAGGRRRGGQGHDPRLQLLWPADQRLPEPLALLGVEGREHLATAGIEDGEAIVGAGLPHPPPDRVERADAGHRQTEAGAQAAGGGDADSQPRERARTEPDRQPLDSLPAASRASAALDLLEQRGRVPRPPVGGGPQQRLLQNLAVAPGAGGGVGGRGVEADEDQRRAASSP